MTKPLLRVALLEHLDVIVPIFNTFGGTDSQFQVHLNCLYLECLTSARRWTEGLAACDQATKSIANKRLHRPLLTWRAVCLANLGASSVGSRQSTRESMERNVLNPEATKTLVNGGEEGETASGLPRHS
jgi:hypothetical protein